MAIDYVNAVAEHGAMTVVLLCYFDYTVLLFDRQTPPPMFSNFAITDHNFAITDHNFADHNFAITYHNFAITDHTFAITDHNFAITDYN